MFVNRLTVLEQFESDLVAAETEITDAQSALEKSKSERSALDETLKLQQVGSRLSAPCEQADILYQGDHRAAEAKLKAERAALVAFDNELADLERDLKAKKQEIVDAELALKKLDHDIGLVAKEKSAVEGHRENLEKQFPWIVDEHQ